MVLFMKFPEAAVIHCHIHTYANYPTVRTIMMAYLARWLLSPFQNPIVGWLHFPLVCLRWKIKGAICNPVYKGSIRLHYLADIH